jgi:hypothetical protein
VAPGLTDDPEDAQGSSPESRLHFLYHHRQGSHRGRERNWPGKRSRTIAVLLATRTACTLVAINVLIWGHFVHLRFLNHT